MLPKRIESDGGFNQALIVKRLQEEGDKAAAFFGDLSPAEWSQQVYVDRSGWTVRHILCHLLAAELAFYRIIINVLEGGEGAPEGIDVFDYNEEQVGKMDCSDPAALLGDLVVARQATIDLARQMEPEDFAREGRHPFFGFTTLDKFLKLTYRHTMMHLRDIRRALQTGGPVDEND